MRWALALVTLLAGCDAILRLQMVSAPADGGPCTPGLDDTMDEDCDGFLDADDVCPGEHDTNPPANADGDGAGDQCDPSNNVPAESIRLFDGFAELGPAWSVTNSWIVQSGKVQNVAKDAKLARQVLVKRLLAETYVDIIDFDPTGVFVSLEIDDARGAQYMCQLTPTSTGVLVQANYGGVASSGQTVTGTGTIRLEMIDDVVNSSKFRCAVTYSGGTRSEVDATATGTAILGTTVVLRTSGVHAAFDSVTVVGI